MSSVIKGYMVTIDLLYLAYLVRPSQIDNYCSFQLVQRCHFEDIHREDERITIYPAPQYFNQPASISSGLYLCKRIFMVTLMSYTSCLSTGVPYAQI